MVLTRKVEVIPYQNDWPQRYAEEAAALREVLGIHVISIHHFGSTAVPGLHAKPVIDILVIIDEITAVDALTPQLRCLGYNAVGEYGIPGRRFFYKGTTDFRTHHIHIYGAGNPQIMRHLIFRDYLRTHPSPARAYASLKENLARQYSEDMDGYIAGKNTFILKHEKKALTWWIAKKHLSDK